MVKMFTMTVTVLTVLVFIDSFPPIQELFHRLILVVIRVSFAKFDLNNGSSLSIP